MSWEKKSKWVDDDGSETVGTPFTAERMNNLEELGTDLATANVNLSATKAIALQASGVALAASAGAVGASGAALAASARAAEARGIAVLASGVALQASGVAISASAGAVGASGAAIFASAAIVKENQLIAASGAGFVFHGASAGIPRPTGLGGVLWIGSVEPASAAATDPWIDIRGVRPGPVNWGEVTALPALPTVGDRCTFKWDPSGEEGQLNPGVLAYWDFEYDGVQPFPWKCIGGQWAMQALSSIAAATSKTFISTGAPSLLTPFAEADYDIEFGCPSLVNNAASNSGNIIMKLKNESLGEFIEGTLLLTGRLAASTTQGGFWVRGRTNVREPFAGIKLQLYYAIAEGTSTTFATPSLRLRPRRVKA